MRSLELIYGEIISDDIIFCRKNDKTITKYEHGIMTLQASPVQTIRKIAQNPLSVPGWEHSMKESPKDILVLAEFLTRMANYMELMQRNQ